MPDFRTIHTRMGLISMAEAEATGTPVNLTHMAVGDGNGNAVTLDEVQTTLVRELFRAPINRVFQSPTDPNRFTAELIVPATAGGFTMREVGIFDADGSLFAVGNLPATYKPVATEGAYADTVVRLEFMVTNADVVTLILDPNIAAASQLWVRNNIHEIPAGGTTGQALLKQSNGDYDADWQSIGDLNVVVEVIEETQELAADQTVVILSLTTTNSLAIYVEGVRLRPDEWTPDPLNSTRLTLGQSYPDGTRIVATQNEPNGNVGAPLMQTLNLYDVPDKSAARANLDVFSRAEARQMSPAGQIAYFARNAAPAGWLKANGAAVSRAAYADLFAAIGTTFGGGDGFNTFNLPDLRGEFIRGWDDARGVDIGRNFASWQGSQNISHQHSGTSDAAGDHIHAGNTANGGSHIHAAATAGAGGHTHDGGTGGAGGHAHGASASDVGNHQHALASGPLSSGNTTLTIGGTLAVEKTSEGDSGYRLINNNSLATPTLGLSSASGAHSHAITIAGVGDHAHGVYINGVGDHAHGVTIAASGDHAHSFNTAAAGQHIHGFTTAASGGNEARPRNIALLACIKY
jgi:microcystin-dependent protein